MIIGKDLSTLEIRELFKELEKFENSYIDKIYYESEKVEIRLTHSELGKINLFYSHPYIYLTRKIQLSKNSGFGLILKKYLEHSKIIKIEQLGSDRILVFKLSNKNKLIFELFFHGNIIIVDNENKILAQSNPRGGSKKDSEIFQLEEKENIFLIDIEKFKEKIHNKEVVKGLANLIGNIYAEEICYRLKLEKLTKEFDTSKVFDEFLKLINEEPKFLFYPNRKCFSVRYLTMFEDDLKKEFSSFSELLENVSKSEVEDEIIEKYKNAISIQKKFIEEYKKRIEEYERTIEYIYSNYNVLEHILKLINENEKTIERIEDLNKKIDEFNVGVKILDLDKKNKNVTLEVE